MIPGIFAAASRSGPRMWTPEYLASPPDFWTDRNSGISLTAGNVSQWADRSGNGWGASQGASGNRPSELSSPWRVEFDPNDFLDISSSANDLFRGVTSAWMFCLFRRQAADASDIERPLLVWSNNASAFRVGIVAGSTISGSANRVVFGGRRLDADPYDGVISTTTHTGQWCMALGLIDYSARTIALHINGELDTSKSSAFSGSGATSNTASQRARIGANVPQTPTTFLDGEQRINMAGVGLPDSGEIDRMFGWAAWEDPGLNLASLLPVDHPYRNAPPTV